MVLHARIQRGRGPGVWTPLPENSQKMGFLSNTGPDHLKNHKSTKPEFNGGSMIACLRLHLYPSSPHQLKKCCQSLTHSDKTVWIRACSCRICVKTSPSLNNNTDIFSEAIGLKFGPNSNFHLHMHRLA